MQLTTENIIALLIVVLFIIGVIFIILYFVQLDKNKQAQKIINASIEEINRLSNKVEYLSDANAKLRDTNRTLSKTLKKLKEENTNQSERINFLVKQKENLKIEYENRVKYDRLNSQLSEIMYGNLDVEINLWSDKIIQLILNFMPVSAIAFFQKQHDTLTFVTGFEIEEKKQFALGEGMLGQAAFTKTPILETNSVDSFFVGDAEIVPPAIAIVPLVFNDETLGCVEYFLNETPTNTEWKKQLEIWKKVAEGYSAYVRNRKIAKLLQETQYQNLLLKQQEQKLKENIKALEEAKHQLQKMNETLEIRVKERTQELEKALTELKTTQSQLIQAEREAVLGKLVSNIAHEINTPFGAIKASAENIKTTIPTLYKNFAELIEELNPNERILLQKLLQAITNSKAQLSTREERQIRKQFAKILQQYNIQDAKFIARQLVAAGLYDKLTPFISLFKNPQKTPQILDIIFAFGRLKTDSSTIITAIEKVKKIIYVLKFHTQKASGDKSVFSLQKQITKVLNTYQTYLKNIKVETEFPEGDLNINAVRDELEIAWQNIIFNAIQALAAVKNAKLKIRVKKFKNKIRVNIIDNGPGIPEEIKDKIFEPFTTTKTGGEGTGLGLNITKKIIERHKGKIRFKSLPGRTEFIVELPTNEN